MDGPQLDFMPYIFNFGLKKIANFCWHFIHFEMFKMTQLLKIDSRWIEVKKEFFYSGQFPMYAFNFEQNLTV